MPDPTWRSKNKKEVDTWVETLYSTNMFNALYKFFQVVGWIAIIFVAWLFISDML